MKLVFAIINRDDANEVIRNLTTKGYSVTMHTTKGGFLMADNISVFMGVDDDKLDGALDVIKKHSRSRTQYIPATTGMATGLFAAMSTEVTIGGATVFVLPVETFRKY